MAHDTVKIGGTFKQDKVMKPNKVQYFNEESYDASAPIGGQEDDVAE